MQGNLNDQVWVRLTEQGKKAYADYIINELNLDPKNHKPKKDIYGYSEYKLWELMMIFGKIMTVGIGIEPFEENIIYYSHP